MLVAARVSFKDGLSKVTQETYQTKLITLFLRKMKLITQ